VKYIVQDLVFHTLLNIWEKNKWYI
jgi:hypothetical protein